MRTKTFYLLTLLIFCTKIYAQNNPNEIKSFRSAEYVELNPSQEIAFEKYINQLNKDKIYRTVTDENCNKYKKRILDFDNEENADYPLQIVYKKTINFNDNFLVKFELDNCVGGSAYYQDFAFFATTNNSITHNQNLTTDLKEKFYQFVTTKFKDEDRNCYKNNYNYIFTDGLNITDIKNNIVYGSYVLYGENAPNCCPEYNGEFEYNLETRKIQFLNEQHKSSFQDDDEISDDEIQILDWTPPPFGNNTKIESEPVTSKNSNTVLNSKSKKQIELFSKTEEFAYSAYVDWVQHCIKTKNKKHYMKLVVGSALAFNINSDKLSETQLNNKVIEQLIKSKTDTNLRNMIFEFYATEPDDVELYGNFTPWDYNKYTEQQQLAIGITIGKYIRKNYISETPKQTESDTIKEEPIKYTRVEKEAVFKGGNIKLQQYIFQNLNFPEIENLDKRISKFIVNASVQILEDGSIGNFSFKSDINFKTQYTFDSELKSELINKYSQYFEDAVASVLVIMPKWIPANSEGKNIKSRVNIPVTFRIAE